MTAELTIVEWVGEETIPDEGFGDDALVRGWCGGVAGGYASWEAYLSDCPEADHPRLEVLRDHLVATDMRNGGLWHQREGIPKFSDGSVLFLSMRAWGDLMSAIWGGGDYCSYAWEQ